MPSAVMASAVMTMEEGAGLAGVMAEVDVCLAAAMAEAAAVTEMPF